MRRLVRVPSVLGSLVLLAFAAVSLSGCSGEVPTPGEGDGPKRIVLLTNGDDPFWDAAETGAKAAEEELGLKDAGYEVLFQRADFTDRGQVEKLKQYQLDPNIVAVGISVYNPRSRQIANELRKLREKGVKVVTIDGDVDREKFRDARYAYLGTDNFVGGRELGRAAKALSPEGSKFAFFVGNTGAANAIARMNGFLEGAGEDFEELTRLEDGGDRPRARKNVEDVLDKYPDVEMLVGIWAYNTPQAVAAVKDRGLRDQIQIACFDAAKASIREMGEGNVDVMVVQNPYQMGVEGVKLLHAMVEGDEETISTYYPDYAQEDERDVFRTELRVVVPDGDSPITEDLFEPETIFFTLPEFEKWLAERGLSSS